MNRILSLVFLVVGIVLIVYGLSAADSIGSDFSRFFTGNPTDRSMWLLLGGVVATVVGGIGLLRGGKTP